MEAILCRKCDLLLKMHELKPDRTIICKWGGYMPELPGKRVVFYVDDEAEAKETIDLARSAASIRGTDIELKHQYGITEYLKYVEITGDLRSNVKNRAEFEKCLERLLGFPHFYHHLFTLH